MALPEILQRPLSVPVLASPMFLASGPELVKAQCQAGVIGSFPALNARPASLVDEWLHEIAESNEQFASANPDATVAPIAVNQIVHRSNDRLEKDMETIVKHKVPIVITSLGAREEINEAVHSYGGIVLHDVIHDRFARKAIEKGADGLIAVAAGAGGHAGSQSPFALAYKTPESFRSGFDHARWLGLANKRVARARSHNEAIRHHDVNYQGEMPIWVLSEVLDFSDISRLFEGLPASAQYEIAANLGVKIDITKLTKNQRNKAKKHHPLVRWFEYLTIVRNTSAHHSRLWNRSFAPVSTVALRFLPEFQTLPEGQNERVYGALCVMNVLLAKLSPGTSWPSKVRTLIDDTFSELPHRQTSEMGCPSGWQEDPIWCR